VTTLPAPMMESSPTETPGNAIAAAPIQTFDPIETGRLVAVPELLRRFVPRIVTTDPAGPPPPPHGVTKVMVGEQPPGFAFVKSDGLLAVALALVTWIVPLASPATVAQISFPETTLNADTGVPPISTLVTIGSLKFVPVITTTHPAVPLVGENDEMVGEVADAGVSRPSTTSDGRDRRYAQPRMS
jgi:hypothetical protein